MILPGVVIEPAGTESRVKSCGKVQVSFCSQVSDRMRGDGHTLHQERFRWEIRKQPSEKVVGHWHHCAGRGSGHHPWRCTRNVEIQH